MTLLRTGLCSWWLALATHGAQAQGSTEPLPFAVTDSSMFKPVILDTAQVNELLRLLERLPKRQLAYKDIAVHSYDHGVWVEPSAPRNAPALSDADALIHALEEALRLARHLANTREEHSPNTNRP